MEISQIPPILAKSNTGTGIAIGINLGMIIGLSIGRLIERRKWIAKCDLESKKKAKQNPKNPSSKTNSTE